MDNWCFQTQRSLFKICTYLSMQLNYLTPNYKSENFETKEEHRVPRKWPTYWCNTGLHHNKIHVQYDYKIGCTYFSTNKNTNHSHGCRYSTKLLLLLKWFLSLGYPNENGRVKPFPELLV